MKTLFLLLLFAIAAPSWAVSYYMSPTGSDSNSGTAVGSPWLTPNHALNCGDTITAASGTYSNSNFAGGKWGTVTCAAKNNVAWLQCATFDTCKISSSAGGMLLDKSFWGVTGWEVSTTSSTTATCFQVYPDGGSTVHHIIFANDVANGCVNGGFSAHNASTTVSVDYIVYIGNIAYNSASSTASCDSGFNIYQPLASDTTAGTHMFAAGNFSWANTNPTSCAGTSATDGEGINFDTFDFDQGGGTAYSQQSVIENNIAFLNGGRGIEIENNSSTCHPTGTNGLFYIKYNTLYGNNRQTNQTTTGLGDLLMYCASKVTATNNLIYTGFADAGGGQATYAMSVSSGDATDSVTSNYASGVSGNNTFLFSSGSFAYGSNTLGTNPSFTNAVNPGAPSCAGTTNVPACMATVIADYTPTVTAAKAYGYQAVSPTSVVDALFPTWLCNGTALITGLPSGLVTPGCGSSGAVTLTGIAISGTSSVAIGLTTSLTATGTYSNSTTANLTSASTWVSSSNSICTVSAGVVTGVALGSCTITASDSGVSSPGYVVTVGSPSLTSITVTGVNTLIAGGAGSQLTGTGHYSDGSTQNITFFSTWTSSTLSICTVAVNAANVTPLTAGSCSITVNLSGITSSPFVIAVSSATLNSIKIASSNGSNTVTVGGTQPFIATGLYSNGVTQNVTLSASWSSSNGLCSVAVSTGIVTGVSTGTCLITASYNGKSNTPALGVQAVSPGPSTILAKGITLIGAMIP